MKNGNDIEIQKHTEFLVLEYENQLILAAKTIIQKYGLEPEDLDQPPEFDPSEWDGDLPSPIEDKIVEFEDWKFHIKIVHAMAFEGVKQALDLYN